MAVEPKALNDLERFLAGDGSLNHRKIRRSMGNRKTRKSNRRGKGIESTRVKLSEKKSQLKHQLKQHSTTTKKEQVHG